MEHAQLHQLTPTEVGRHVKRTSCRTERQNALTHQECKLTVTCQNSLGQLVSDSNCSTQPKPVNSITCTLNCSGSPLTSQSCQQNEICPVGTCKPVGNYTSALIPSNQTNVRIQSGEFRLIRGHNRADINIIVSKGGLIMSNEKPSNKRIYFEGPARDYSIGKKDEKFIVKDSCGARSVITVGQESSIQLIFADGIQEFKLVPGNDGFRHIYQGQPRSTYFLEDNEFYPLGHNYLDSTKTSAVFYSGACRQQ